MRRDEKGKEEEKEKKTKKEEEEDQCEIGNTSGLLDNMGRPG